MKLLVLCRPRAGVEAAQISAHAAYEMVALRALKQAGTLLEAYSPGGPGAVLILEEEHSSVQDVLASLPLVQHGLIDTEVIELHPFVGI
jgi:hypothetical protein